MYTASIFENVVKFRKTASVIAPSSELVVPRPPRTLMPVDWHQDSSLPRIPKRRYLVYMISPVTCFTDGTGISNYELA